MMSWDRLQTTTIGSLEQVSELFQQARTHYKKPDLPLPSEHQSNTSSENPTKQKIPHKTTLPKAAQNHRNNEDQRPPHRPTSRQRCRRRCWHSYPKRS
ncbi:hypothetical protein BDV23DRAFT_163704 [Aspergillus alliaceus]|uniref:Uncharacterized protein n=1 Tax=Petromyces alliaceus TaxID=209559 RepID=A0A5N7BWL0_PETAA|nr:hypothetical protein BDV23DRAFT_163704 [Aspergillus alliaceus]